MISTTTGSAVADSPRLTKCSKRRTRPVRARARRSATLQIRTSLRLAIAAGARCRHLFVVLAVLLVCCTDDDTLPDCRDIVAADVTKDQVVCDESGLCIYRGQQCYADPTGDIRK